MMSGARAVAVIVAALVVAWSAAQPTGDSAGQEPPATVQAHGAPPALAAVGLTAGFPSYQTVAPMFSVQAGHFGFQAKASWTPAGPFVGVQLRGYPPVPVPVPLYVGVGAGFYGRDLSYHAAVGAHVPLGLNLRLDLEGGVANVPLLGDRTWAPHLSLGLSYAFPVQTASGPGVAGAGANAPLPACQAPAQPDAEALPAAVARTVEEWLLSARATYGSVYTDLEYGYRIASTRLDGAAATVVIEYTGSVREIATGQRHEASGRATGTFAWKGCYWSNTGVSY